MYRQIVFLEPGAGRAALSWGLLAAGFGLVALGVLVWYVPAILVASVAATLIAAGLGLVTAGVRLHRAARHAGRFGQVERLGRVGWDDI